MSGWGHGVQDVEDARDNHTVPGRDVPVGKDASDTTIYSGVFILAGKGESDNDSVTRHGALVFDIAKVISCNCTHWICSK